MRPESMLSPVEALDLGLIGNCHVNALVDGQGRIVWWCLPRFDGDPVFCKLVDQDGTGGIFAVELEGVERAEQRYLPNTAILVTRLLDGRGEGIEITDFAPRFERFGRSFRPSMLVRRVRPLGGSAMIRVRLRPRFGHGAVQPAVTRGSHHIRYADTDFVLRVSTDAPITYVLDESLFRLDRPLHFLLGPDESLTTSIAETARDFEEKTLAYWQSLVGRLHLPFEWQEAVIRSAITLKLCSFEETGAIIAAPTTSLPEAHGEGRNWDYRYCWLRDAHFVVRALNRLGYVETMAEHLGYLRNIVSRSATGYLQPVYGIGLETALIEREAEALSGYRGNRPVRIGNQAYEHLQHDGYGSVILAATQAFFDQRLREPAGAAVFLDLERAGEKAWEYRETPDAGLWEFRGKARVHTHSAMMCWAACDRLSRIATCLGLDERAGLWRARADEIREAVLRRAWSEDRQTFTASFEGDDLDASLLLMPEIGFLGVDDARFRATVAAIERDLVDGPFVFRYRSPDDFGRPAHAFLVCSFWYVDVLGMMGRREEARTLFEQLLRLRNPLGLLTEHADRTTGALWGNFPQTYSHVGLINCAMRLSRDWDEIV